MGAKESGSAFLAGVLAKLPAEQQAQAKAIFEAAEAQDALITIGDGVLARSDYSKQMDGIAAKEQELTTQFENLNSWYAVNQAALDDYKVLKAAPGGTPKVDPSPIVPPADPRKLVEEVINEQGRDYVNLTAFLNDLSFSHYQSFSERLNTMELVNDPRLGKPVPGAPGRVFSLQDVYQAKFGERVAQKAKEAEDARIDAEVTKRLTERMGQQTSHPFPLRESPSVLDTLSTKDGPAAHSLDTAVAEYDRLQHARGV